MDAVKLYQVTLDEEEAKVVAHALYALADVPGVVGREAELASYLAETMDEVVRS